MNAYLTKEISLGRVAGPFDAVPFPDGFVVSPLTTVPKRDSDERSVIVDLSWLGKLAREAGHAVPRSMVEFQATPF